MKKYLRVISLLLLAWSSVDSHFAFAQGGVIGPPLENSASVGRGGTDLLNTLRQATLPDGVRLLQDGVFSITSGRPLEVAAQLLSRKLGMAISFEEAAWISSKDVLRAADVPGNEGVTSDKHPRGPLVPRGGTVTVIVPTTQAAKEAASPAQVIQAALDNHRSGKNPGDYRLVRVGEGEFSIVGDSVDDETGRQVQHFAPLDAKISFPAKDRTLQETLDVIYQSVSTVAHVQLAGISPNSSFLKTRVNLGADSEVARQVLSKALRRPGGTRLSWSMRYNPEGQVYLIFFAGVQSEVPLPRGGVGLLPLSWPKQ